MVFEEIIGIYMSEKKHRSGQRDQYSLKRLWPYFSGRDLRELKRGDVRRYVTARLGDGVCESTVKRELKLLSAAINFVRIEHDYPELPNPVQSLGLDGGEPRVRWISQSEASSLIRAAGMTARRPHLRNFVRLALSTGCRKNELLALEWRRVDFERSHLRLESEHTKTVGAGWFR